MKRIRAVASADPSLSAIALSAGGIVVGILAIGLAWACASRQLFTTLEMPWLASGALGGLAVLGTATTLLAVHLRRRSVAREVVLLDQATAIARQIGGSP